MNNIVEWLIGRNSARRIWYYRKRGAKLGQYCYLPHPIVFEHYNLENVKIGDWCFINRGCYLDNSGLVVIGNDVAIAAYCRIVTTGHITHNPQKRCGNAVFSAVRIEDGVWLGIGVAVLPGTTIGRGSVIGAGAVVARSDVPSDAVVCGVPGVVKRTLEA